MNPTSDTIWWKREDLWRTPGAESGLVTQDKVGGLVNSVCTGGEPCGKSLHPRAHSGSLLCWLCMSSELQGKGCPQRHRGWTLKALLAFFCGWVFPAVFPQMAPSAWTWCLMPSRPCKDDALLGLCMSSTDNLFLPCHYPATSNTLLWYNHIKIKLPINIPWSSRPSFRNANNLGSTVLTPWAPRPDVLCEPLSVRCRLVPSSSRALC